jgi:hypothetical protein
VFVAGDFRADLESVVGSIRERRPFALARFHDGEFAVCEGRAYRARSPWNSTRKAWLRPQLLDALHSTEPGYVLGVSPQCCTPAAARYYSREVCKHPATFATIFQNANYSPAFIALHDVPHVLVGSSDAAHVRVPVNAVEDAWDLDGVVAQLIGVDKPVFVAAGPAACVIVHKLWERYKQVPIVDIGALFDHRTRDYHSPTSMLYRHACDWGRRESAGRTESIPSQTIRRPSPRERVLNAKRR